MLTEHDENEPAPLANAQTDGLANDAAAGPAMTIGSRSSALPALPYVADTAQFGALVHQQLAECRRWSVPLAVLCLGVERVHLLHDRHVAAIKAQLLQEAGQRVRARVRNTDRVVRVGREAFGVVLHDAADTTARSVEMRLVLALQMPFRIGNMTLHIQVRSGFAVYPQGGVTGEALVLAAERARGPMAGH